MFSKKPRPVDLYSDLRRMMDYYLALGAVVDKRRFLCLTLFYDQLVNVVRLEILDLYKPANLWDAISWAVYTIYPNSIEFIFSLDLAFTTIWHLTSNSFSAALHDVTPSWPMTYKLTTALAFLIAVRGCLPRYRYDFLTKLGWVKFLGQTLTFFLTTAAMVAVS